MSLNRRQLVASALAACVATRPRLIRFKFKLIPPGLVSVDPPVLVGETWVALERKNG